MFSTSCLDTYCTPLTPGMVESFSPADTSSQTITVGETWSKLKQVYAGPDNDSKSGGTFNIEFNELEGMPVTILNKIWYEYSQAVRLGRAQPQQNARNKKYVDYMSSCYYFQLAPDGMSINYWCRFTGVFPTGLPFSSFSGKTGSELIRVSMPYSYMFKEDMLVSLLYEFNKCFNPNLGSGETTIERFKSVFGSESKTYGSNAFKASRLSPSISMFGESGSPQSNLWTGSSNRYGVCPALLTSSLRSSHSNQGIRNPHVKARLCPSGQRPPRARCSAARE